MVTAAAYAYLGSSALAPDGGLTLQTSGGPAAHPRFFTGFLTSPAPTAVGLPEVARSRYFRPCLSSVRWPGSGRPIRCIWRSAPTSWS